MLQIKCLFPKNYYLLRKVNIKVDNETISRIGHNEIVEIDNQIDKPIKFKLDYHRATIRLSDFKENKYMILYFDFRDYFPFSFTDIMFRNSLRAKLVDKDEFDSFDTSFYGRQIDKPIVFNCAKIYTITVGILLALQFMLTPFLKLNNDSNIDNFSFGFGIISIVGFIYMILNKNRMSDSQYNIRTFAFGIASVLILFYTNIYAKFLLLTLALSIILIASYHLFKK